MNAILEQLLKLQRLDIAIRTLGHDLQQIPKKSKIIDAKVSADREPFDKGLSEKESLEKERASLDQAIASLEEKERKLKLRMPEIRSNEEYSALLKEMDAAKKERERAEDQALKDGERLDELAKTLPELDQKYKESEARVAEERKALKSEADRLSAELLTLQKERQTLQGAIKPGWFNKYTHIAAQRNGLAVVAVRGGTCQGCFIGVRPKLIQDLHYGEEVVFCEGCQRVLYLDDAAAKA
ncbi:MAG: C4-type zinc ribbon domain-containing protein [Acidobacteriota bacterium]